MSTLSTQSIGAGFAQNNLTADAASSSTNKNAGSLMNMNSFLTLFTTQLQYQDPNNPLESHELSAQLAQFSTVEKLSQIQTLLEGQQSYLTSINTAQMVDVLGKQVVGSDNSLQLKDGEISNGRYALQASAAAVTVKIYNDQSQLVRTMSIGAQNPGSYDIAWDGQNDAGEKMKDGIYRFDVQAADSKGVSLKVTKSISGEASSFRVENGSPFLILNGTDGIKLSIASVLEVNDIAYI